MKSASDKQGQTESAILKALRDSQRSLSLQELLSQLNVAGAADETAVKAAIWHLVSASEVTSDRMLRVPARRAAAVGA